MKNFLGAIFYLPGSKREILPKFHFILPNFHFILPNFHFILPNFYFVPPWRIFVCSVEISDYLRGDRFLGRRADALFRMRSSMALSRKSDNSSVDILDYPARKRKILRKFHFILPKFYFILPKFYFVAPWRIFIFSLEILDFLGRN